MKLISCHHIKKRARRRTKWPPDDDTLTDDNGCRGQERHHRNVKVHLEVVSKSNNGCSLRHFPLFLMCLMLYTDFQHQHQHQHQHNQNQYHHHSFASNQRAQLTQRKDIKQQDLATTELVRPAASSFFLMAEANSDANRLYEDLMMTYNRIVRPVQNNTDRVLVKLSLKLSQLIDVNLKNQMMTTNVWLNQEWTDYKLKWDPVEYGGIEDINLPAEQIWLPDIVLYNSAEGYFAVSIMTKAKVRFDGLVTWNPPAIFRSSCQIDITYFPFDSQNCHLKFGSWTFGGKIDLRHINGSNNTKIERGTDLSEYYQNVEWDIMEASAIRNVITYACCPDDEYPDVTFKFILRRKPLFYTVNLILPCIGITILSILVFYLPSDSGEKVTLTISILVSLIFFLSVLIETIPSTSLAMPLLGKYLVFTMILITVSVCATVCVLNIHFRTPSTHSMPPWVKRWFVDRLPKYLFMNVPKYQSQQPYILPEQLIYLHNQAYGTQFTAGASQQQWLSSLNAAQPQVHSSPSNDQANGQSSMRQLEVGSLEFGPHKQISTSPSSLFLPYLQSEAARRLQMQRSRSSDKEQKSCSEAANQAGTSSSTVTNNNCDRQQQQQQQMTTAPGMRHNVTIEINANGDQQRRGRSRERKSLLKRLFSPQAKSVSSSRVAPSDQQFTSGQFSARKQSRGSNPTLQPDSSSSLEDTDYQHHRHFQARASICSNNLWRIGPTRKCSLALPPNYPTYYRPNLAAQLAGVQQATQQTRQQQTQSGNPRQPEISSISGCLQQGPGHYHAHLHAHDEGTPTSFDSSGASSSQLMPQGATVGALVQSSASSLPVRPKIHPQQQQHMCADHHQLGARSRQDQSTLYTVVDRQVTAGGEPIGVSVGQQPDLPPPPPPLSHAVINRQAVMYSTQTMNQQRQHQIRSKQQQMVLNPADLPDDDGGFANFRSAHNSHPSTHQIFSLNPQITNPPGQYSSSIKSGSQNQCHVSLESRNLDHGLHGINTISHQCPKNYGIQFHAPAMMSRSRSSDHRLCTYASSTTAPSQPQPLNSGQQIYLQRDRQLQSNQQAHQRNHHAPPLGHLYSAAYLNNSAPSQQHAGPSYYLQAPQSIGRALGHAYMQRLQRQPTIYSSTCFVDTKRPSRPLQRGLNHYLIQQHQFSHQQGEMQAQNRCQTSCDNMRRSKSQSSLDRRAKLHVNECAECNYLRRTESRLIVGDAKCRCEEQRQIQSHISSAQLSNTGLLRCRQQANKGSNCLHSKNGTFSHSESTSRAQPPPPPPPLTTLGLMKLVSEVDKAIQNAMFIAQHIDNLDEFESVKENWKYIAMVIDRIFLIVFFFACIIGTVTIFGMVPWSNYTVDKPIDLQLTRLLALNLTGGEPDFRQCRDF